MGVKIVMFETLYKNSKGEINLFHLNEDKDDAILHLQALLHKKVLLNEWNDGFLIQEIKYIVAFENSKGEILPIGGVKTDEEANKIICDFLKERNYTSYYSRRWKIDDKTTKVDVGSYTEFFYIMEDMSMLWRVHNA